MEIGFKLLFTAFCLASASFKTVEEAKIWATTYDGVDQNYIQELEKQALEQNRDQTIFYPAWVCDQEKKLDDSLCSQNIDNKIYLTSNIKENEACLALKIFKNQKVKKQELESQQDLFNLYLESQVQATSKEQLQVEWECNKYCDTSSKVKCDFESFKGNRTANFRQDVQTQVGGQLCRSNSECLTNQCLPVPLELEGQGICREWNEDFMKQTLFHICTKFNLENYLEVAIKLILLTENYHVIEALVRNKKDSKLTCLQFFDDYPHALQLEEDTYIGFLWYGVIVVCMMVVVILACYLWPKFCKKQKSSLNEELIGNDASFVHSLKERNV